MKSKKLFLETYKINRPKWEPIGDHRAMTPTRGQKILNVLKRRLQLKKIKLKKIVLYGRFKTERDQIETPFARL